MFEEIDGHELAKKTLQTAVSHGKTAHAYMFSGDEGVGKKLTAISFAKKLNCSQNGGSGCECPVCSRIDAGIHPDVSVFEYTDQKTITVDNVRDEIDRRVFLKPFESQYKIFIIDGAERMNSNAQNAFLKTVEEPPPYSVIILITHLPAMMLPTIRSRCRTVRFGKLDGKIAREKLLEKGEFPEEEIDFAVTIAGGSPGKALKLTQRETLKTVENIKTLAGINPANPQEVFLLAENILGKAKGHAAQRAEAEKFADCAALWIRNLINADTGGRFFGSPDKFSEQFARKTARRSLTEKSRALEEMVAGIKTANLNCRLALENFIFKFAEKP